VGGAVLVRVLLVDRVLLEEEDRVLLEEVDRVLLLEEDLVEEEELVVVPL
jgi:hypothetical protein